MPDQTLLPTSDEDDPALEGLADDETGQSIDPNAAPVPEDPAALDKVLADIGRRTRAITQDPVPLLVAQIHDEIQQLLRLNREICDGVELAADQVQDKRIEHLEAGPEATLGEIFIEVALVFFLESPLVGLAVKKVLQQGYRFVGRTGGTPRLVNRAGRLDRLQQAAEQVSAPDTRTRILALQQAELGTLLEIHRTGSAEDLALLKPRLEGIRRELDELSRPPVEAATAAATAAAAERPPITAEDLKKGFAELDSVATEFGVGVVKAGVAGLQKFKPGGPTTAPDSLGVQMKSLAQFHLRSIELYLGLAAADADMLRSVAQGEPLLAPECRALLAEMHAALRRAAPRKGQRPETIDPRTSVMIEVEKLIWALLIPNAPPLTPAEVREILKDRGPRGEGGGAAAGGRVLQQEAQRPKPPQRLVDYWKARFYADKSLTGQEVAAELRKVKVGFLALGGPERLIDIVSVPFKQDS